MGITLDYVNTKFNLANFFTKAMSRDLIEQESIAIGLCQLKLKGKLNSHTSSIMS